MLRVITFMMLMLAGACFGQPEITPQPATNSANISARELIRQIETQYQGKTSHGKTRMIIQTENWKRTLEMESWSEGRDKFLTKILTPQKERGTCTLKVDNNIWNYIPRIDRMIKIPSSLMGESWMGSHLTNDDLVKENKIDELYTLSIIASTAERIEIKGIPQPEAAVVWGKLIYVIDSEKLIPLHVDYYDEEGVKVRRVEFTKPTLVNNKWIPKIMKILPLEKPNEYTEMEYLEIEFDLKLSKNLFSLKSLRNR